MTTAPPRSTTRGGVDARRQLGHAVDALIRTARARAPGVGELATRALDLWRTSPRSRLEGSATSLSVDGVVALSASEEGGEWLLPAFMAGLRTVALRPQAAPADLLALAVALGSLTPDADAIARFHDWLWADGAEGFEVEVTNSFTETGEALALASRSRGEDRRSDALAPIALGLVAMATAELDRASTSKEFSVPVEEWMASQRARRFEVSPAEFLALGAACDDAGTWTLREILTILRHPELRGRIPADRFARQAHARLAAGMDLAVLRGLASLPAEGEPWARDVLSVLETLPFATAIASGLSPTEETAEVVADLLGRTAVPGLTAELARALLARATRAPMEAGWVVAIVRRHGVDAFVETACPASLPPELAVALVRAVFAADGAVGPLLAALPPAAAAAVLDATPGPGVAPLVEAVAPLLGGEGDVVRAAVEACVRSGDPRVARVLAEAVAAGRVGPVPERTASRAAAWIARVGRGADVLLPLARTLGRPPVWRLAALGALLRDASLAPAACRWRFLEVLDPPEVRARLAAMRATLRELS